MNQQVFEDCINLMRDKNSGRISSDILLDMLEKKLGKSGMDMMALWGVMCANEAVSNFMQRP